VGRAAPRKVQREVKKRLLREAVAARKEQREVTKAGKAQREKPRPKATAAVLKVQREVRTAAAAIYWAKATAAERKLREAKKRAAEEEYEGEWEAC
jgi:hypothetical protein